MAQHTQRLLARVLLTGLLTVQLFSSTSASAAVRIGVTSNGVTITLLSGYKSYDSGFKTWEYTQAYKLMNSNSAKTVLSCGIGYSLLDDGGHVVLSNRRSDFTIVPPRSSAYGYIPGIPDDSRYGDDWSRVRLDNLTCATSSHGQHKKGSRLEVSIGTESTSRGYVYTSVTIKNKTTNTVTSEGTGVLFAGGGRVVGIATLTCGSAGSSTLKLRPGKSVSCKLRRDSQAPFARYVIDWITLK